MSKDLTALHSQSTLFHSFPTMSFPVVRRNGLFSRQQSRGESVSFSFRFLSALLNLECAETPNLLPSKFEAQREGSVVRDGTGSYELARTHPLNS